MLESVPPSALVYAGGRVTHDSQAIGLVLSKSSLEIRTIAVKDLPLSFLDSVAIHSYEAISISMGDLRRAIHYSSLPRCLDPDFS